MINLLVIRRFKLEIKKSDFRLKILKVYEPELYDELMSGASVNSLAFNLKIIEALLIMLIGLILGCLIITSLFFVYVGLPLMYINAIINGLNDGFKNLNSKDSIILWVGTSILLFMMLYEVIFRNFTKIKSWIFSKVKSKVSVVD